MSLKTLETKMHMKTFLTWKLDPRVSALVESTCFRWFLKLKEDLYRQDSNLLTALASMYDESQDHFVIGNPKMDIDFGLEDVLYITGLPIDGEQVSGFESENIKNTIMDHFKITEERAESLMKNSGIDLSRLKLEFERVPQGNEIDLEPYFKAYLLFLLGEVILPNNSSSFSPMYLPLLGLNDVNHYAWGAAMLANMKEALGKVKKAEKFTSLCGFSYVLTVFALERFPDLRERCGSSPRYSLPSGFPLILGWMEALSKPNKDTKNVTSVEDYQKKLQEMKEKDVVWQPYKNRDLKLSKKYASQLPMVFSCTPCSCFNEGAYNRPDVCFKQLGLEKSQVKTLRRKIRKGTKLKLSKHKNKNWKSVKPYYIFVTEQWTKRYENFICEIARDEVMSVPEGGRVASGGYSTCHSFHIDPERPYLVEEYEEAHSSEKERELPEVRDTPSTQFEDYETMEREPTLEQPQPQSPHKMGRQCFLMDLSTKDLIIAEGRWMSNNPNEKVHSVPLGTDGVRVAVDVVKVSDASLWKKSDEFIFMGDALNSFIAWPQDRVVFSLENEKEAQVCELQHSPERSAQPERREEDITLSDDNDETVVPDVPLVTNPNLTILPQGLNRPKKKAEATTNTATIEVPFMNDVKSIEMNPVKNRKRSTCAVEYGEDTDEGSHPKAKLVSKLYEETTIINQGGPKKKK